MTDNAIFHEFLSRVEKVCQDMNPSGYLSVALVRLYNKAFGYAIAIIVLQCIAFIAVMSLSGKPEIIGILAVLLVLCISATLLLIHTLLLNQREFLPLDNENETIGRLRNKAINCKLLTQSEMVSLVKTIEAACFGLRINRNQCERIVNLMQLYSYEVKTTTEDEERY